MSPRITGFPQRQDEDGHSGPSWLRLVSLLRGSEGPAGWKMRRRFRLAVSPGGSVGPRRPPAEQPASSWPLGGASSSRVSLKAVLRRNSPPKGFRAPQPPTPSPAGPPAARGRVYGGWAWALGSGKLAVGGSTAGHPLSGCPGSAGQSAHRMTLGISCDLTPQILHLLRGGDSRSLLGHHGDQMTSSMDGVSPTSWPRASLSESCLSLVITTRL